MQLPNVEQLDSEDKNWFARAIAGMVVADGRVDESETAFLKEALGFLKIVLKWNRSWELSNRESRLKCLLQKSTRSRRSSCSSTFPS